MDIKNETYGGDGTGRLIMDMVRIEINKKANILSGKNNLLIVNYHTR